MPQAHLDKRFTFRLPIPTLLPYARYTIKRFAYFFKKITLYLSGCLEVIATQAIEHTRGDRRRQGYALD